MLATITRAVVRCLDALASLLPAEKARAAHLDLGQHGEEAAYFYLRGRGYIIVARNYRSPRHHGELDLVGWHDDVLCFIEVKNRSSHDVKPAEAAVDSAKRRELIAVARDYWRRVPGSPPSRFDIVTLYYPRPGGSPEVTLFQNAFPLP